jgi:putative peptide zinc metalloprotease protein
MRMTPQPKFRQDLTVSEHPERDGSKTIVLKDPVSAKYFRLSVFEYQFLKTLDGTRSFEEALETFNGSGHYCTPEEGQMILQKAAQFGLILGTKVGTAQYQMQLRERHEAAMKLKRFSSVYFLFIPIVNPDKFLERTVWLFRLFANKWTIGAVALLTPGALYLLISGISKMQHEYLFFFNWENLLYLWITIALTKLFHEFSHAYTAKSFGLHVPQMGIAFLIFFPCLYCNTTDAWQLADRRQRIVISGAGIIAETGLAVAATYIWYFSKPGMINSLAFYLMAVSFVSTVFFNGNPLMKFDGYFMLTDYLRIPNLMPKSLGYLKYLFMNRVLGLSTVQNTATHRREKVLFGTYGVSAFVYRIFLYSGIVAGVYYRFDKTLGIVLAMVAFGLFVVRPVLRGIRGLYAKRSEMSVNPFGALVFATVVLVILGPLFIPLSTKSVYPCYVDSAHVQKLTVPFQTSVAEVFIQKGSVVQSGETLFTLDATNLKLALSKKEIQRDIIRKELALLQLDPKHMGEAPGREIELLQVEDEISEIKSDLLVAQGGITAPFEGVVTGLDYRLQTGFRPGQGTVVGEVQSVEDCVVRALIPEKDRWRVQLGQKVEIWLPMGTGLTVFDRIDAIRSYHERDLKDSPFSSRFGGELATEVRDDKQRDVPLEAQYECAVKLSNPDLQVPLGMTGRLVIPSPSQSLFSKFLDELFRTFNRESLV